MVRLSVLWSSHSSLDLHSETSVNKVVIVIYIDYGSLIT